MMNIFGAASAQSQNVSCCAPSHPEHTAFKYRDRKSSTAMTCCNAQHVPSIHSTSATSWAPLRSDLPSLGCPNLTNHRAASHIAQDPIRRRRTKNVARLVARLNRAFAARSVVLCAMGEKRGDVEPRMGGAGIRLRRYRA